MSSAPEFVRVALWSMNLGYAAPDLEHWAATVETTVADAAARGARVLVMPEWVSTQWLAFAPADLPMHQEVAWMADCADQALGLLRPIAARHGIALLCGSMAVPAPGAEPPWLNRAHLFLPDGRELVHDKLCLTPSERDSSGWDLSTGSRVAVFDLDGARAAILICLDIELPALAARLAPHAIDLLLVPSYTHRLSGFSRVFTCAKARAVELLCAVCAVGFFGELKAANGSVFHTTGGAAVYGPCEPDLGMTGIVDELTVRAAGNGAGPVLLSDVPVGTIRALREASMGEVWPGAWDASHVLID